jgi:hypothetical protein
MSGVSLPVTRPPGRALIVGQPAFRSAPMKALLGRGYECIEVDEPYDAMVLLCQRPMFFSAVVFSLNSLYREELSIIGSLKRRFGHIDIWLSDTDGRQAALAEAMRCGADGLVADDGLHRVATGAAAMPTVAGESEPAPILQVSPKPPAPEPPKAPPGPVERPISPDKSSDPLLTAEELRALLQESPGPIPAKD